MEKIKIITKVRYENKPFIGQIRLTKISGNRPLIYSMVLMHDTAGIITTKTTSFADVDKAISHAVLYGFNPQIWKKEIQEV